MGLSLKRKDGQTWREAAISAGAVHGLQDDVAETYDGMKSRGFTDEEAAFGAAYEWDVLELTQ